MPETSLQLIDIDGLVKKLNSVRVKSEGEIELTNLVERDVPNGFLFKKRNGQPTKKGRGYLFQRIDVADTIYRQFFSGDYYIEKRGCISFEKGLTEARSNYSDVYESVILRINKSLKFLHGNILPICEIDFLIEKGDFCKPIIYREDYVKKFVFRWQKTNLSKILPTEWFLRQQGSLF
jgi:hypothetical protein